VTPADLPAIRKRTRAFMPLKDAVNVHRPLLLLTLTAATASAADVPALVAEVEALREALEDALELIVARVHVGPVSQSEQDDYARLRALLPTKGPIHAV
jgi:hypothetical protein